MKSYNSDGSSNKRRSKPYFITQNSIMLDLVDKIKLVAKAGVPALLTGENGTGKEVIARLLNYYCKKPKKDMVAINCGAIPSELVESELFGHEKGAFTGAHSKKEGCFELADKGVLFLDEIGEMPLNIQVKLLRAVELGSFRRVGGKKDIEVDLTLVSATNKVLTDQVKAGSFREDLYYRLNVIELHVPTLRERKEDIPLLSEFFINNFTSNHDIEKVDIIEETMELLMAYDWPGNVRELKNVIERAVVFCDGGNTVTPAKLPSHIRKNKKSQESFGFSKDYEDVMHIPIGLSIDEIERYVIEQTLESVNNNKTEAAKILGCVRKTLHNKLDKYENVG